MLVRSFYQLNTIVDNLTRSVGTGSSRVWWTRITLLRYSSLSLSSLSLSHARLLKIFILCLKKKTDYLFVGRFKFQKFIVHCLETLYFDVWVGMISKRDQIVFLPIWTWVGREALYLRMFWTFSTFPIVNVVDPCLLVLDLKENHNHLSFSHF